jgi:hypothetical protein
MKKVKVLSTEKDRLIQTFLSSVKHLALMKQAKRDLFVEALAGYSVLFLAAVGLTAVIVMLLTWLSVDLQGIILRLTCLPPGNIAVST